jgi:hypothetical protein
VAFTVLKDGRVVRTVSATRQADGSWRAPVALRAGESAYVARGGVRDTYGELNGVATRAISADGSLTAAPGGSAALGPAAGDLPRTGFPTAVPIAAVLLLGTSFAVRRRRAGAEFCPIRRRD